MSSSRVTLVMPTLEPWVAGFTISGNPSRSSAGWQSLTLRSTTRIRRLHAQRLRPGAWCAACPCPAPNRAHRCRCTAGRAPRGRPARCRPRRPAHAARSIRGRSPGLRRCRQRHIAGIHAMRIDAAALEAGEHGGAAHQRYLALGRHAAEQHGDLAEFVRVRDAPQPIAIVRELHIASPTIRHFGRQRAAMRSRHFLLHLPDQRLDVAGGGLALVQDEIRVLGRHHGAADAQALEARALDQARGMVAGRIGEHRAAAPLADGLGLLAALEQRRACLSSDEPASKWNFAARNHSSLAGCSTCR